MRPRASTKGHPFNKMTMKAASSMSKILRTSSVTLLIFIGACSNQQNVAEKSRSLTLAYQEKVITLTPPLAAYDHLHLNINESFASRRDFIGIRVDLNAPHTTRYRNVGEHPSAITYFFESGEFIREEFHEDGTRLRLARGANQSTSDIDYEYARSAEKK